MADQHQLPDPIHCLQTILQHEELFDKIIEFFPYPVQVFSPEGTALRINQAAVELLGLKEDKHVGIYNVFQDPIVKNLGIEQQVRETLTGKTVYLTDLNPSYRDVVKYFDVDDRDIQTIHLDITCFPLVAQDQTVTCFIAIFLVKNTYQGRVEILKGREHIEKHWQDRFDLKKTAQAANLSPDYFARLFKKQVGVTPHEYYLDVKVAKIREFLRDENLSISQAFSACGLDYHGHFARVFKQRTGCSPSQYRRSLKT